MPEFVLFKWKSAGFGCFIEKYTKYASSSEFTSRNSCTLLKVYEGCVEKIKQ